MKRNDTSALLNYHIRKAIIQDSVKLSDIARRSYAVYIPRIGKEPAPMKANYSEVIKNHEVWVIENNGVVIGFSVLIYDDKGIGDNSYPLLETIAVDPEYQGQKIGSTLLKHSENAAYQQGIKGIKLYTNALMTENLNWYSKMGYQALCAFKEDGYDRIYFEKVF